MLQAALFTMAVIAAPAITLPRDVHSYAEIDKVIVRAVALDLAVDFDRRELAGTAELALDWKDAGARKLVLDTRDLAIEAVDAIDASGAAHAAPFSLAKRDPILGAALEIRLDAPVSRVRIRYRTSPNASGLQWMTPAQTAGRQHPFMFSQSESIHARSWVPLQDTPSVRFTYTAHLSVPKELRAIMSAPNDAAHPLDGDFRFAMEKPIPSYLLAIAVGDLAARATGPRSAVYAEPSVVEAAANEFADTEKMIGTTESLYGPYRWTRYDILVLPPSFPFGGMENPCMTFATPTVIGGDRSLVSLVAHELAHSWSGNLVTNATWKQMWLNEGFTTYVENRIVEAVYGKAQADEEFILAADELRGHLAGHLIEDWAFGLVDRERRPKHAFAAVGALRGALPPALPRTPRVSVVVCAYNAERTMLPASSRSPAHTPITRSSSSMTARATAPEIAMQLPEFRLIASPTRA